MPRRINPAIDAIREQGSGVILKRDTEEESLPTKALLKASRVVSSVRDAGKRPLVAFVSSYTTAIPGHAHLRQVGDIIVYEVRKYADVIEAEVGGCVCDGISMGTPFSMNYSLPSRELIADQIETIVGAHPVDGIITLGNCDKIVPGMLMGSLTLWWNCPRR